MCLPYKCLRCWVTFSAVLSLILGVVAAIVAGVQMSGVAQDHLPDEFKSMAAGATYAFLAFGILLIFIGIAGIIGSIKDNDCCLNIYNIGTCVFFIIFLILAIVLFAAVGNLGNMRDLKECENSSIFGAWDKWEKIGYNSLCTSACKCKIYKDSPLIAQASAANFTRKIPFVYEGIDRPPKAEPATQPAAGANTTVNTTKTFAEITEIEILSLQAANASNATDASNEKKGPSPVKFQECPDYQKVAKGVWNISEESSGLKWVNATPAASAPANASATPAAKPAKFLQAAANASANSTAAAAAAAPAAATPYVSAPLNYSISNAATNVAIVGFFGTISILEDTMECSGVCQKRLFYTFSNINDHDNGAPKDSCGGLLYDGITKMGRAIAIASLIIALILLVNVILACCLKKQNDKKDGAN